MIVGSSLLRDRRPHELAASAPVGRLGVRPLELPRRSIGPDGLPPVPARGLTWSGSLLERERHDAMSRSLVWWTRPHRLVPRLGLHAAARVRIPWGITMRVAACGRPKISALFGLQNRTLSDFKTIPLGLASRPNAVTDPGRLAVDITGACFSC